MEHANTGQKFCLQSDDDKQQTFLIQFCKTYQLQKVVSLGPEKQRAKTNMMVFCIYNMNNFIISSP